LPCRYTVVRSPETTGIIQINTSWPCQVCQSGPRVLLGAVSASEPYASLANLHPGGDGKGLPSFSPSFFSKRCCLLMSWFFRCDFRRVHCPGLSVFLVRYAPQITTCPTTFVFHVYLSCHRSSFTTPPSLRLSQSRAPVFFSWPRPPPAIPFDQCLFPPLTCSAKPVSSLQAFFFSFACFDPPQRIRFFYTRKLLIPVFLPILFFPCCLFATGFIVTRSFLPQHP